MARSEELRGTGHQLSILPLAVDRRSDVLKSGGRGESQLALSSVKSILIKYSPETRSRAVWLARKAHNMSHAGSVQVLSPHDVNLSILCHVH